MWPPFATVAILETAVLHDPDAALPQTKIGNWVRLAPPDI